MKTKLFFVFAAMIAFISTASATNYDFNVANNTCESFRVEVDVIDVEDVECQEAPTTKNMIPIASLSNEDFSIEDDEVVVAIRVYTDDETPIFLGEVLRICEGGTPTWEEMCGVNEGLFEVAFNAPTATSTSGVITFTQN